jgi:HAD superfamily hydrolase (TIGR01490 family)
MENSTTQKLALFDLDNTLLNGDSDHAWGEFLISRGLVDADQHRARNDFFYEQYKRGVLDIHGYVAFTLDSVRHLSADELQGLHGEFMRELVSPMMLKKSLELVNAHKKAGDYCVIITATNEFITTPIAKLFGIDHLLPTELETVNGKYTGKISGIPCYQDGKVEKLSQWLEGFDGKLSLSNSIFYSDSKNDLPLLQAVEVAVAVDPDDELRSFAEQSNWGIISLRD